MVGRTWAAIAKICLLSGQYESVTGWIIDDQWSVWRPVTCAIGRNETSMPAPSAPNRASSGSSRSEAAWV